MKYINDNDLYFNASIFASAATNSSTPYTITVVDKNNSSSTLKTYNGNFYFYSLTQRIYYGFLLRSVYVEFTSGVSRAVTFQGIVTVKIFDNTGTQKSSCDVVLAESPYFSGSGLTDENYYKTTGGGFSFAIPDNVETPRIGYDFYMPMSIWVNNSILSNNLYIENNGSTIYNLSGSTTFNVYNNTSSDVLVSAHANGFTDVLRVTLKYDCSARYFLIWYDNLGYWQSQPFYGKMTMSSTYGELTNLRSEDVKYQTQTVRTWELQSDYIHKQETYRGLFDSRLIYVFDSSAVEKYSRVNLKTTDWTEKINFTPERFSVSLESATTTLIY